MKLIALLLVSILFITTYVFADDTGLSLGESVSKAIDVLKLNDLKQGFARDFVNDSTCYTFTKAIYIPPEKITKDGKEIKNFWDFYTVDIGYTSTDKLIVGGSINIIKLSDFTDIFILNLLRFDVGVWGGWGRCQIGGGMEGNNEWAGGLNFTLLKITK